jgi:uncharacterized protein (DUF302 family)
MKYYFEKILNCSFDEAVERATEGLNKEGFGVLTEINIHEKLNEKLGVDFRKYRILGACNPDFAYQALQEEDKIGTMLPCNVIVQEISPTQTEVAAVDPMASMQSVGNEKLAGIANEVQQKLKWVIDNI